MYCVLNFLVIAGPLTFVVAIECFPVVDDPPSDHIGHAFN